MHTPSKTNHIYSSDCETTIHTTSEFKQNNRRLQAQAYFFYKDNIEDNLHFLEFH